MGAKEQRFLVPTHLSTRETARPIEVTGRSEREIERVLRGMLINCHEDWFIDDVRGLAAERVARSAR